MRALKYQLLLIFLVSFNSVVLAQNVLPTEGLIKGRVYKEGTDSVIANASVYYGGFMQGTMTDKFGDFELAAKVGQIPFTVSCIGYYSNNVNYIAGKPLVVYLSPKVEELKTVTIRLNGGGYADGNYGMTLKEKRELFIKEFIGQSNFSNQCTITNLNDIRLYYDKKKQLLTAECSEPIIIENSALGYRITYYLDRFARTPSKLAFAGNYIFREQPLVNSKMLANRERAYVGSRMQFIRSIWRNSFKQDGFRVYSSSVKQMSEKDFLVSDTTEQKNMKMIKDVYFANSRVPMVINQLTVAKDQAFISQDGYYSPGLQWSGGMGQQRIADLLPYEYQSAGEKKLKEGAPTAQK